MGSIVDGPPAVLSWMNRQNETRAEAEPAPIVVQYIVTSFLASGAIKIMKKFASFPDSFFFFFQTVCGSSFDLIFHFRSSYQDVLKITAHCNLICVYSTGQYELLLDVRENMDCTDFYIKRMTQ